MYTEGLTTLAEANDDTKKWHRSSYCADTACVEVAEDGDRILMRDSKDTSRPHLGFARSDWQQFVHEVRSGRFRSL
jgi:hypothetical protein